jgi:predicted RND superfamily exporter protein
MNQDFVGASRFIVVIKGKEKGAIKDKGTLGRMEKLGIYMTRNIEKVGGTMSLTNMVQSIYRMYHEGSPRWEMVPVEPAHLGQIFFMLSSNMAPGEMDQYVSVPDYTHSSVTAFLRDYDNASIKNAISRVKDFAREMEADEEAKIEIKLAGGILGILAAVNEEVEWSYWAILAAIFSSTFLLCLFAYRSPKAALILIIPLAAAQVLSELLMLLLNIDLNVNSLPVAAIGVGLGIDYGIYLLSRLKEETLSGGDFDTARFVALSTTGKVILFTAFNLSVGVSFWLLSEVKFQAEMGLLIGTLLWFNCISALVFIPALTGILRPKFVMGTKEKEVIT